MIPRNHRWLGETVVGAGCLDAAEVPKLANITIEDAWSTVCAAAKLEPPELVQLVAKRFGLPVANLADIEQAAAASLPLPLHRERLLHALRQGPQGLEVATADPTDAEMMQLLQFSVDTPVLLCVAAPGDLRALQGAETHGVSGSKSESAGGVIDIDAASGTEPAIIKLGNQMFRQAVDRGASDIHVQPLGAGGVIRMRIDGVLRRVAALPRPVMLRLIARVKLLASMDPTDQMRPQDGRLRLRAGGRWYDLRVSSVPASGAEKLVIRLLGTSTIRSLPDVGIGHPELDQLSELLSRGQGIVLVTGPTGSGKTTTLYSALAERNQPAVNISTVEDPVEIRLPWLAQIEVNAKAELTFASALRSVLRQDPDIVLIGEIRDSETAQIAVQAALTGHLVLATLHTNDAVTAIPRLLDLGVTPQLVGQSLAGVSAQRLLRRLCAECAQPAKDVDARAQWLATHGRVERLLQPAGCAACGYTGFKGRLPVCQVFEFTPEMAEMLEAGQPLARLRALAAEGGMRTLAESALDRLRAGETSVDEVLRTLGTDFWLDLGRALKVPPFRTTFSPRSVDEHDHQEAPVLIIVHDGELRRQAAEALRQTGHGVIETDSAEAGREMLEYFGAASAILVDLAGLKPDRVQALLGVRDTLGGAAIPILGLRGEDESINRLLTGLPGVLLRPRPADFDDFVALLRDAIAVLD